jgi:hypothetical protein
MRYLLFIVLIPLLSGADPAQSYESGWAMRHNPNAAWQFIMWSHTNYMASTNYSGLPDHFLVMTWFPTTNALVSRRCVVTNRGLIVRYHEYFSWAKRNHSSEQLSEEKFVALQETIASLPSETSAPTTNRLVLVSFRLGEQWITRKYDRAILPTQVNHLYEITGVEIQKLKNPEPAGGVCRR